MICDKCGVSMDERTITCYFSEDEDGNQIDFNWCDRCNPYPKTKDQKQLADFKSNTSKENE